MLQYPDMASTLNRKMTRLENMAMGELAGHILYMLNSLGGFTQLELAGNNSQSVIDGKLVYGNANEPSFPHMHFIMCGLLDYEYIPGVPLTGPPFGEMVNMRANGTDLGNTAKEKWTPAKQQAVITHLRALFAAEPFVD